MGMENKSKDVLYVEDVVRAYDLFAKSKIKPGVWNLGGGVKNTTSLLEFLVLLKKKIGKHPKVSFSNWRPSDQKVYISETKKIENELDWKAQISFEKGVDKLFSWVKENKNIF